MKRTLTGMAILAVALVGCNKKQDANEQGEATPPTQAATTAARAPADAPPTPEPPKPPERKPLDQGPVTLWPAAPADAVIATLQRDDAAIELSAELVAEDTAAGTATARVSARIGDKVSELHSCPDLHPAVGGRAVVQLDAAGALYVVCNTRAKQDEPDYFKGIRLVWNDDTNAFDQTGELESEAVFDPDTMDFGEGE